MQPMYPYRKRTSFTCDICREVQPADGRRAFGREVACRACTDEYLAGRRAGRYADILDLQRPLPVPTIDIDREFSKFVTEFELAQLNVQALCVCNAVVFLVARENGPCPWCAAAGRDGRYFEYAQENRLFRRIIAPTESGVLSVEVVPADAELIEALTDGIVPPLPPAVPIEHRALRDHLRDPTVFRKVVEYRNYSSFVVDLSGLTRDTK